MLTRPEMAICLISETLFGHKEDIREHLAALLHTLIITLDSMQPLLRQHAQQVIRLYTHKAIGALQPEQANGRLMCAVIRLMVLMGCRPFKIWCTP